MKSKTIAIILAVVVVVGGVAFAAMRFLAPSHDDAIKLAPQDSVVYVNLFLDPSSSQKMAIKDLIARFPKIESTDKAGGFVDNLLNEAFANSGVDYTKDIKPWLGKQIAGYVAAPSSPGGTPRAALMIATTNEGAARDAVAKAQQSQGSAAPEKKSYKGVDYEVMSDGSADAVFDGFLVAGTEDGVKASIDTSQGDGSLEGSSSYNDAVGRLNGDRLLLGYVDSKRAQDLIQQAGSALQGEIFTGPFGTNASGPVAFDLYAKPDGVVFEGATQYDSSNPIAPADSGLMLSLPKEAWAALSVPGIGDLASKYLDALSTSGIPGFDSNSIDQRLKAETGLDLQQDILSWMGDAGLFVEGTTVAGVGGAFEIESTDPATSTATVAKLAKFLASQGAPVQPLPGGGEGFSIQSPDAPEPFSVIAGDKVTVAYGTEATQDALSPSATLKDSQSFNDASNGLGDGYTPSLFVDFDAVSSLIESTPLGSDTTYDSDVKPWLDPLYYVAAGTKRDGSVQVSRFVIGAK